LRSASARDEQIWTLNVLARPVDRPRYHLWRYRDPALVLGGSQRIDSATQLRASEHGIDIVERRAGGGAVLAGPWMLSLSVALPPDHPLGTSLIGSYRWLGLAYVRALKRLGVDSRARPPDEIPPRRRDDPLAWACFGTFSPWEVASGDGRKLVGLAQVRRTNGILVVGGVLVQVPPWSLLTDVLGRDAADAEALRARTAAVEEYAKTPIDAGDIAIALQHELADTLGEDAEEDGENIS
jgi:lipoate-protein ligase A